MSRVGRLVSSVVGVVVLVGLASGAGAATAAHASPVQAIPCPHGRPVGPRTACTGPVTHHAGGGGGVLTVIVSAVVGVAIAAGGFVLVRRRIAEDATRPRPARGMRRPS